MTARVTDRTTRRCTDCGWTSKRSTPGLADHALRRHSCEKYRRSLEASARDRARQEAIDRTPKPCTHPIANHKHGQYATYTLDGCRCLPCVAAASEYGRNLARETAYGRTRWTDGDQVRQHLAALAAAGVGLKRVAAASGVSHGSLSKIVYGTVRRDGTRRPPSAKVLTTTAEKLLAVSAADVAPGAVVDGTGTARRLQALLALGWSVARLAAEHDLDRQALDGALVGRRVQGATAAAVRTMYDAIGDRRPSERNRWEKVSASRSRHRAAAAGWVVPAMWDPETIDDPHATPAAPVELADAGGARRPVAALLDEWVHLVRGGEHPERAAARCGRTLDGVRASAERTSHADALRTLGEALLAAASTDKQEAAARRILRLADAAADRAEVAA